MSAPDNKDKNAIAIGPAQGVCDKHDPTYYPKFKKWADDYFVIKHRGETRGLGGIFFDDLKDRSEDALLGTIAGCRSRSRSISRRCWERNSADTLLSAAALIHMAAPWTRLSLRSIRSRDVPLMPKQNRIVNSCRGDSCEGPCRS